MSLELGKAFDRSYNLRLPILEGYYNIGIYFNKRSSFLLFRVDPDFSEVTRSKHGIKINMFKNLESSKFCETFLKLHNYRKNTLDIRNQFEAIKSDYYSDVHFILNESISLAKFDIGDKTLYDTLTLYGFCLSAYANEFIFVICERQNIVKRLNKKVVRTTGLQIATSPAITLLNEFYEESRTSGLVGQSPIIRSDEVINLAEEDSRLGEESDGRPRENLD